MPITKSMERIVFQASRKSHLATLGIFKNLPSDALAEIENFMIEKNYEKQETLFMEDDPAESLWFVEKGLVKEIYYSPDGDDQIVSIVGAQGMLGTSCFERVTYGFHAVAETVATVVAMPIRRFQETMEKYPPLAKAVLYQISSLLRKAKNQHALSQDPVEKRLLHVLLELALEFDGTIPLIRKEVAAMAGTTTETCIRVLGRLEADGLIASTRGRLTVINAASLRERMEAL